MGTKSESGCCFGVKQHCMDVAQTLQLHVKNMCPARNTAAARLIQEVDKQCGRCSAASSTHFSSASGHQSQDKPISVCKPTACVPHLQLGNSIPLSTQRFPNFGGLRDHRDPSLATRRTKRNFTEAAEEWLGLAPPEPRKQEGEEARRRAPAHPGRRAHTMRRRKGGL